MNRCSVFLRLRFPWSYRLPFYLLLALLFAYPAWLGHLSLENRLTEMAWFVLGFPTIAGLTIRPAGARCAQPRPERDQQRHPLGLAALSLVVVRLARRRRPARAYAMSMSFDPTKGLASGLQLYVVVPLLLSWHLLWTEGADHSKPGRKLFAVAAPLALLALALPGQGGSVAETRYLRIAARHSRFADPNHGRPPDCLLRVRLVARNSPRRSRPVARLRRAWPLSTSTRVDLHTLAPIQAVPMVTAVVLLVISSIWHESAVRMGMAAILVIAGLCFVFATRPSSRSMATFPSI